MKTVLRNRAVMRNRIGLAELAPAASVLRRIGSMLRPIVARWSNAIDDETLGRRALLAIVGSILGNRLLPGTTLGRPMLGAVGAVLLSIHLEKRDSDNSDEMIVAVPDLLDRIVMCVMAGRSVEQAIRVVAQGSQGEAASSLRAAMAALDAGASRKEAFNVLTQGPAGAVWAEPVAAMDRAERLGVPLADVLIVQAREMRHRVRATVETQVRAAPLKLVFPLVFCFLPAFIVLAVGPVAVSAIRTLTSL
jgi:tight adherence protein C